MTLQPKPLAYTLAALALATLAALTLRANAADEKKPAAKAALTVAVAQPQLTPMAVKLAANGNITAWQEASVGTEANGLRLESVKVNVGDVVKRGEVLAKFAPDTIEAEIAQSRAAVAEAEATLAEASANAQRARELQPTGALSTQQIAQYTTAEQTARSRLEAQKAIAKVQRLRLKQTEVRAPDSGVISARNATVGAVLPAGQELFRLIRKGRLEWRAEVSSAELASLKPGVPVTVVPAGGAPVQGTVRMLAPTVDPQTRNALVYVDLPEPGGARAGMFARGEFTLGSGQALTLPQTAVLLRDGFSYVLRVGPDSKVVQTKVAVGRRSGDRIEIKSGIDAATRVVASGGGFLIDGDTVRVVDTPGAAPAPAAVATK